MLPASKEPILQAKKIKGGWSTQFLSSHIRRGKAKSEFAHERVLAPPALLWPDSRAERLHDLDRTGFSWGQVLIYRLRE